MTPDRIGKYERLNVTAHGGQATVYRAKVGEERGGLYIEFAKPLSRSS